jgi:hypothetical protein
VPHLYTCQACRTEAPQRRDYREDAEADQQAHRDAAHGGHRPIDGDGVRHVHHASRGDGILPRHTFLAVVVLIVLIVANSCHR